MPTNLFVHIHVLFAGLNGSNGKQESQTFQTSSISGKNCPVPL